MLKKFFAAKISACSKIVGNRQLSTSGLEILRTEVGKFNVATPIQSAVTPPSVWFNDPLFHELDKVSSAAATASTTSIRSPTLI